MILAHARTRSCALGRAVLAVIGADEVLLGVALALITVAVWPVVGRLALIVPGLVLLWIVLPQRASFVHRPPPPSDQSRRKP